MSGVDSVEKYSQMMRWLTRPKSKVQEPRIMDQAALSDDVVPGRLKDEIAGNFDPSQETYEEYLQRINLERPFNMAEGGQLVAPSVDGSRPGYQGFASKETQKKIQKISKEKLKVKTNTIKKVNNWTNNWFKKNAGNFKDYDSLKKQLIKDWTKESKNKIYKGHNLTTVDGLPNIAAATAEGTQATRVSNNIFDLNFPIQRPNKELIFQKGYANYRLQNPKFTKKLNDYFDLVNMDKRGFDVQQMLIQEGKLKEGYGLQRTATGTFEKAGSKSIKGKNILGALNIDREVLDFVTTYMAKDSPYFTKTGGENIYDILGKHIDPEKVTTYKNKINIGADQWRKNLDEVVKLANKGLPPTKQFSSAQLISQMKKESQKMAKLFNLKNLPDELKYFGYSQDHVLGLREAIESGDPRIARQTLNNTIATTRAQNTFLGFKEFGNQRRQLMKDFKAVPKNARGPIIEKLNALSEEFIPGKLKYNVRKDGSLKINVLQPEKTFKARTAAYEKITKTLPKNVRNKLDFKKLNIPRGERGYIEKELLEDFAKAGKKGARVASKYGIIPEFIFGVTDYLNEKSKGKSKEEARGIAVNNLTFGAYDNPKNIAYMKGLKKTAESMGIDARAFDDIYNLNVAGQKFDKYLIKGQERIENLRELGYDEAANDLQKNLDRYVKEQNENLTNLNQKVIDQVSISKAGGAASPLQLSKARDALTEEDYYKPFKDITKVAQEKLTQEKRKAFPTQKFHVDTAAGTAGEGFYKAFDHLIQGAKNVLQGRIIPYGPERFRPLESERQKEARYLKEMEPRELYLHNKAKGYTYDQPITEDDISDLQYNQPGVFFSKGGRASHMGGGIASIRRPNAIPPESGPNPQGLPSMYNRVKRI